MCTLPLLAGENVGHAFVVPTVASSVDLVVHIAQGRAGRRRVREIVAVPGRVEGDVVEMADMFTTTATVLSGAPRAGRRIPSGSPVMASISARSLAPDRPDHGRAGRALAGPGHVMCIWLHGHDPPRPDVRRRRSERLEERIAQAGIDGVSSAQLIALPASPSEAASGCS